jgi:predicted RNase H-like nuclease (RuvC/YqgF family)
MLPVKKNTKEIVSAMFERQKKIILLRRDIRNLESEIREEKQKILELQEELNKKYSIN